MKSRRRYICAFSLNTETLVVDKGDRILIFTRARSERNELQKYLLFGIGCRILILPKGKDTNNGPQTNLIIAMKLHCIIIFFCRFLNFDFVESVRRKGQ